MKYDFDSVIDRRNSASLKWEVADGELPMWVADMDFKTAPAVIEALERRCAHGIFGYSIITDEWSDAYINWWKIRHNFTIERDWLVFCTGVVPAISSAVRALTNVGENVLVQTPVYNIFFNSIVNNGRRVQKNPLLYRDGRYEMDFCDLERKLSDPQTSLMLLCNPQNPAGVIWDRDTLARVGQLCHKYGVTLFCDEIHCDLCDPAREYTPFASVSDVCRDISITAVSPTKAFNIAGLATAAFFAANARLRHRLERQLNTDEVAEPNAFAAAAAIAAFSHGGDWLDALRTYIYENKLTVRDYLRDNIPQLSLVSSEATYLLWLDVSSLAASSGTPVSGELAMYLRERTGLFITDGAVYGGEGDFLRMNIACPRSLLLDGLERLRRGVTGFIDRK